ncbi:DUF2087 domain-containing protein [uncultured Micrococcus sp.]|uniref:DUF2087 domain-containing protein n=1 Tax=uncultured Micrococcus sp. TaxID=114051 RepID=UPI0025E4A3D7|nr:DUF2087 domain-containing protein [uncultured Micrococcus sp.]
MTAHADRKHLVRARMQRTGETYTAASAALCAEWEEAERFHAKTVHTFFDGPRLRSIPARRKARVSVLFELLRGFRAGRDYPEREVNEILRRAHDDVASLRRELVDYGLLEREAGVYRVPEEPPGRDPRFTEDLPADHDHRFRRTVRAGE